LISPCLPLGDGPGQKPGPFFAEGGPVEADERLFLPPGDRKARRGEEGTLSVTFDKEGAGARASLLYLNPPGYRFPSVIPQTC
jgi:hypothetical protein